MWFNKFKFLNFKSTWAADKILGAPQVYPNYGDLHNAWAQANDFHSNHFIELEFPHEVYVTQVNIYETYHSGGVVVIKIKDKNTGEWRNVWESAVGAINIEQSRIFSPEISKSSFKTNQIRIELDCSTANSYCEIDAVGKKISSLITKAYLSVYYLFKIELVGKRFMVDNVQSEITLSNDMVDLLSSEEFSDIVFEVEGKLIKAHRNILTARSDYFRAMLCENLKQDRLSKPIHIDNVSYNGFRALLYYLYTGNIGEDVSCECACELRRISSWYDLEELGEKSYLYLQTRISIDNVLSLFLCAHRIAPRLEDVESFCLKFIAKNFQNIYVRPEFKTLPQNIVIFITQYYAQFTK